MIADRSGRMQPCRFRRQFPQKWQHEPPPASHTGRARGARAARRGLRAAWEQDLRVLFLVDASSDSGESPGRLGCAGWQTDSVATGSGHGGDCRFDPDCGIDPICPVLVYWQVWAFQVGVQTLAASVLLLIAPFAGIRTADATREDSATGTGDALWRPQFSISTLLGWTASLAVLLGSFPYVSRWLPAPSNVGYCVFGPLVYVCYPLMAAAALWTTLGRRSFALRIIPLALLVAAVACTVEGVLRPLWRTSSFSFLPDFLFQTVLLAGSLWLVRLAGYRLVWREGAGL